MKTPERKALAALFFLYAVGIVSWVPRFPEVKQNLHVSNGEFGTLLSLGAVGSLVSLLAAGHLAHRFGSRKAMIVSSVVLFSSVALIVHTTQAWQFLICITLMGAATSAFHIAVNGQAFYEQEPTGENLIPRLHGYWSAGALASAILSGLLTGKVGLVAHVDTVSIIVFLLVLYFLRKMGGTLMPGVHDPSSKSSIRQVFTKFEIDWKITLAICSGSLLEFGIGDWGAIFSKEELHTSARNAALPYILLSIAMIVGRLNLHRLTDRFAIDVLIKRSVFISGVSFMALTTAGKALSHTAPTLGLVLFCVGVFIAGLGESFLAPVLLDAANRRSKSPGSVVLGRIGVINTILTFFCKTIIAWIAQLTSISFALMLPALALMAVVFAARAVKEANA